MKVQIRTVTRCLLVASGLALVATGSAPQAAALQGVWPCCPAGVPSCDGPVVVVVVAGPGEACTDHEGACSGHVAVVVLVVGHDGSACTGDGDHCSHNTLQANVVVGPNGRACSTSTAPAVEAPGGDAPAGRDGAPPNGV